MIPKNQGFTYQQNAQFVIVKLLQKLGKRVKKGLYAINLCVYKNISHITG